MRSLLLCVLLACLNASGQIVLRINDGQPVTIAASDVAKLARHTAVMNEHGKQITYQGALMRDLLAQGGVNFGEGLRGKQLSTYASDPRAACACCERLMYCS